MAGFKEGRGVPEPMRAVYDPDHAHGVVLSQHPDDAAGGLATGDRILYIDKRSEHLMGKEGTVIGFSHDRFVYTEPDEGEIHKTLIRFIPDCYVKVLPDDA